MCDQDLADSLNSLEQLLNRGNGNPNGLSRVEESKITDQFLKLEIVFRYKKPARFSPLYI
jgi:hypothetical protein